MIRTRQIQNDDHFDLGSKELRGVTKIVLNNGATIEFANGDPFSGGGANLATSVDNATIHLDNAGKLALKALSLTVLDNTTVHLDNAGKLALKGIPASLTDGTGITLDPQGRLRIGAVAATLLTGVIATANLPSATDQAYGIVKPDGSTIQVVNGLLTVVGAGSGGASGSIVATSLSFAPPGTMNLNNAQISVDGTNYVNADQLVFKGTDETFQALTATTKVVTPLVEGVAGNGLKVNLNGGQISVDGATYWNATELARTGQNASFAELVAVTKFSTALIEAPAAGTLQFNLQNVEFSSDGVTYWDASDIARTGGDAIFNNLTAAVDLKAAQVGPLTATSGPGLKLNLRAALISTDGTNYNKNASDLVFATDLAGYMPKSGGTFIGHITLPGTTPSSSQAVPRSYVDSEISSVESDLSSRITQSSADARYVRKDDTANYGPSRIDDITINRIRKTGESSYWTIDARGLNLATLASMQALTLGNSADAMHTHPRYALGTNGSLSNPTLTGSVSISGTTTFSNTVALTNNQNMYLGTGTRLYFGPNQVTGKYLTNTGTNDGVICINGRILADTDLRAGNWLYTRNVFEYTSNSENYIQCLASVLNITHRNFDNTFSWQQVNCGSVYSNGSGTALTDLAELVPNPDADLEPTDVAIIDPNDDEAVCKHTGDQYDKRVAGIVSTAPGYLLGVEMPPAPISAPTNTHDMTDDERAAFQEPTSSPNDDFNPSEGKTPMALAGRVPCKVTTKYVCQDGSVVRRKIRKGDIVVSSSIPGHAMCADPSDMNNNIPYGTMLGKAMQDWDPADGEPQEGVIKVWVNLG